jgi:hypothetical protein
VLMKGPGFGVWSMSSPIEMGGKSSVERDTYPREPARGLAHALNRAGRGICCRPGHANASAAFPESAGAGFRSLADTWADTTTPHGRLMLTVLGGLAEFERELIRARTGDGRARAKARGVRFGRPPKLTSQQRGEALHRLRNGETLAAIARIYGVHPTMIGRLA